MKIKYTSLSDGWEVYYILSVVNRPRPCCDCGEMTYSRTKMYQNNIPPLYRHLSPKEPQYLARCDECVKKELSFYGTPPGQMGRKTGRCI